jgi:predicted dehydrogenase
VTGGRAALPIGLVGCGNWGRYILRDLVSLGCEVSVVAPSPASRVHAQQYGAARIAERIDQLPSSLAGVVVATPTVTHAEVVEELLPRAVPVFVEKPLTADVASARRIADAAGERVFVMDKWRYHPGVEMLREIAHEGELGPVEALRAVRVDWGNPHADVDAIWILAPHDLSIAHEILGHVPEPVAAHALVSSGRPSELIGVLGTRPRVVLEVSARQPERRRVLTLQCRDGAAVLGDAYADAVVIRRGAGDASDGGEERRPISSAMPLLRELEAFVGYLNGGPPPRGSAHTGAEIVAAIERLRALAGLPPGSGARRQSG